MLIFREPLGVSEQKMGIEVTFIQPAFKNDKIHLSYQIQKRGAIQKWQ